MISSKNKYIWKQIILIILLWLIYAVKSSSMLRTHNYRPDQVDMIVNEDNSTLKKTHRSLSNNTLIVPSVFSEIEDTEENVQVECFGSMFELHNVRNDGLGVTIHWMGVHTSSK